MKKTDMYLRVLQKSFLRVKQLLCKGALTPYLKIKNATHVYMLPSSVSNLLNYDIKLC